MFYLTFFVVMTTLHHVQGIKQINITIMVPGLKAFQNLVEEARGENPFDYDEHATMEMNDLENESHTSTAYVGEQNDYDGYNAETSEYYYATESSNYCINETTGLPDVKCILMDGNYQFYPWSYLFAKPGLEIAVETIKKTRGLLDGYDINLHYYDSGNEYGVASARLSQIQSVDARMLNHMTALIGPMNAYCMSRVVSFTAHWDILNLTPGSISSVLRRTPSKGEEMKNTMVRTGPIATQVGKCVSAILKHSNWTTVGLELFEDDSHERHHYFMAEGIYNVASEDIPDINLKQMCFSEFYQGYSAVYDYETILKLLESRGRTVILSAEDFVVRDFLRAAAKYGHAGEYVYIIIDLEDKLGPRPWEWTQLNGTMTQDDSIRDLFESALIVTLQKQKTRKYEKFLQRVESKFGRNLDIEETEEARDVSANILEYERRKYDAKSLDEYFKKNQYPAFFHDSLLTLAHVLDKGLKENETNQHENEQPFSGSLGHKGNHILPSGEHLMKKYILGKEFQGVTGKIAFDEIGDRLFDFSILDLDPIKGEFRIVAEYDSAGHYYREVPNTVVHWPHGSPPPDVPECGFDGRKCVKQRSILVEALLVSAVAAATLAIVIIVNAYKRYKLKKELESQLWRVYWSDITWPISSACVVLGGQLGGNIGLSGNGPMESEPSLGGVISYYVPSLSPAIAAKRAHKRRRKWSSNSRKNERIDSERKTSAGSLISEKAWCGLTTLGTYKSKTVVVKLTNRKKVELSKKVLMELKHMRDITHEHLTRFEGACIDFPHICILSEYCGKGSLRDILMNDEIQLDWMFRVSLMNDLAKGMTFLHASHMGCHGNLKSTNCVVDSRFVLKITDYSLNSFRSTPSCEFSERECEKKLWTAPELLRCSSNEFIGTQKGDVYSLGIILQEIALRKGTFYVGGIPLSCREIIAKVRYGFQPVFRPVTDSSALNEDLCILMQRCWNEDAAERPDFNQIRKIIERFNRDNPGNLVENLLHRMEHYAINLEGLVEDRTAAYMEEKRKADDLLYQMLPVPVVDRLKRGDSIPAEAFESVTICFTDIVGFTTLSATSNPMEIISLLNDLYTCFDAIIDNFDVYKVETIGDAYMLVSGLPVRNGIRHAGEIARTALALLKAVTNFKIRHRPDDQLKLRIGIHTGPCCAGVVGLKMPRYCLFGDTVNTASRMESSGEALFIHVSDSTKQLLDRYKCFQLQLRGEVPIKGKGSLTTYWLLEETDLVFETQSLDDNDSPV